MNIKVSEEYRAKTSTKAHSGWHSTYQEALDVGITLAHGDLHRLSAVILPAVFVTVEKRTVVERV